ncbi:unnamed protein product [Bursaphelenchus xylophilus]|uniref:(pine wood nematode) hypothetical protein n=1 Tax=Bursaphelenchus xylophilus TaxID=6326 RepID=A0A1I7SL97_BURXY|nr:unnamed protein product [Bursaphelenchus xylophilus]CAG9129433.1 unnamed protein product [Bursaphelenchus xylophilus]
MGNEQSGPTSSATHHILNGLPTNNDLRNRQQNGNFTTYRNNDNEFLTDDEDSLGEDYKRVQNLIKTVEQQAEPMEVKEEGEITDDSDVDSIMTDDGLDGLYAEMEGVKKLKLDSNPYESESEGFRWDRVQVKQEMMDDHENFDELLDLMQSTNLDQQEKKSNWWDDDYEVQKQKNGSFVQVDTRFPSEYAYLTSLRRIDEEAVKRSRVLYDYLMREQTSMEDLIQKQIGIICLYWAQGIIESRQPVFLGAILSYKEHKVVKYMEGKQEKRGVITYFALALPKEKKSADFRPPQARVNQLSIIREGILLFRGYVVRKTDQEIIIKTDKMSEELTNQLTTVTSMEVDIFEEPNEFVPQAMLCAVQGVKMGLIDSVLMPHPGERGLQEYADALPSAIAKYNNEKHLSFLNDEQKAVVYAVEKRANEGFPFILYGPPGTGKTETISALVMTLLKKNPDTKILICTPSNMAANRVAEKLMEHFGRTYNDVLYPQNLLRMFSCATDYEKRDKKFDKITSVHPALRKFTIPSRLEMMQKRVIVSTLACSTHLINNLIPRGHFDYILIDEAGQASEAEVWIPLGGLADKRTSVVLCGDPKQLGPVITLNLPKYMTDKFISPLYRFMQNKQYLRDKRICVQLRECFRCHDAIVHITSKLFYQNTLRPGGDAKFKAELEHWGFLSKPGFPVMFIDVKSGQEEREPSGNSYGNASERAYITEGVIALMRDLDVAATDIGIISPYRYQSRMIMEELKKDERLAKHIDELTVDSVERFQGSERKVIFMTCTRTRQLGFVACALRLNTSITRAQQLLVVVGNAAALRQHDSWRNFIDYCRQNSSYKSAD